MPRSVQSLHAYMVWILSDTSFSAHHPTSVGWMRCTPFLSPRTSPLLHTFSSSHQSDVPRQNRKGTGWGSAAS